MFKHLIGHVTLLAIAYIKREWEAAKELQNEEVLDVHTGARKFHKYNCSIVRPTLLPLIGYLASESIPIELLHPSTLEIDENPISLVSWIMPWPTVHVTPVPISLSPASFVPLRKQHDQYRKNSRDLLLKAPRELELLRTGLAGSWDAERMAQQVHVFAKELRQEFSPIHEGDTGNSQPIPREFAPTGPASTMPQ